ncbi:MAG TPA: VWA-like domain-containing protein [Acidimicrobiales bacterium]|nr:VWA-like domain-containing protein [Acidimicrobiales bacterium]
MELNTHKLLAARLWAVGRYPYLTAALFASPVVASPGLKGAAVDEAWRLYIDPETVEKQSVPLLGALLVHHAGHLVRDHAGRAKSLGVERKMNKDWALAADAEINDDLIGTGLRMPDDRIVPQELGWKAGRLAEEYYHAPHLDTESEPDCGSGSDGRVRDWELRGDQGSGLPPGEQHLLRSQVASEVLRYCKEGVGRLSAGWRRWAEDLLEPKVDWRRVLAAEIRKGLSTVSGRVDYTYRRPSRRASASPDIVMPALERPVPEVLVLCDTSGSMGDEELATVLAEVDGLLKGVGLARNRVRVMAVDAAVQTVQSVTNARQLNLVGGGGTDMGAGLVAAARLRPRPSVVVVLTDGMTPWPAQAPKGMQVVVGMIGNRTQGGRPWAAPAWARVVPIDAAA